MKKDFAERFNAEVEAYRQSLLLNARKSDWTTFKMKGEKLFEYLEAVELVEVERRFFNRFWTILIILGLAVIGISTMDAIVPPDMLRFKYSVILLTLAACSFELYCYLAFRTYVDVKKTYYNHRKDRFLKNIENDFKEIVARTDAR